MAEAANMGFRPPEPLQLKGNLASNFKKFKERFAVYMKATNNVSKKDDVKVAMLLNLIGEEAHEVYNTFDLTSEQAGKLHTVMEAFEKYCVPRKNIVYERFNFYNRNKLEGESFDQFLTDVRKLAKSCEFNDTDSMIRDRLVLGINDDSLQERLLRVSELTLIKTIEYCQAAEVAQLQAKKVQGEHKINTIKTNNSTKNYNYKARSEYQKNKAEVNFGEQYDCKKCGTRHSKMKCPAYGKQCNNCLKYNHYTIGCRLPKGNYKNNAKKFTMRRAAGVTVMDEEDENPFVINAINNEISSKETWYQELIIEGKKIRFKLDTGSQVNILPLNYYNKLKNKEGKYKETNKKLIAYGGDVIKPVGSISLKCKLDKKEESQNEFIIIDTNDTPILGLKTCIKLNLVKRIRAVNSSVEKYNNAEEFIKNNKQIFEGLGKYPIKQKITLNKDAVPKIRPPYRVAERLRPRLKETLEKYESLNIITKVQEPSEWVSNLVIVEKPNGSIRLCLDPKDINNEIKREHYQIPTAEELAPKLANKKIFTVLDMTDGFFHLELDKESSKLCTFHSPFGRYRFNRMPFGIASAPEIFQRITMQIFGEIEGVTVYFDDLVISANTDTEHDITLQEVIRRAREYGIKFNKNKMQYKVPKVNYLGRIFSEEGVQPDPENLKAIINLNEPKNKTELQSILGMITYLSNYIPQLAQVTAPMRQLLKKNVQWHWEEEQRKALLEIKNRIVNLPTLKCFDPTKQLILQADSSKDGIGCSLLMEGSPIGFASRSLSPTEQRYAQIEKELLSIYFGCKRFHNYIYGRKIIVHSDHKPLEVIIKKELGQLTPRLQRMCLSLLRYNIDLKYIPGKHMYIADLLSRNFEENKQPDEESIFKDKIHAIEEIIPISKEKLKEIKEETSKDKMLNQVVTMCQKGWPKAQKAIPVELRWAWKMKDQILLNEGVLMFGNRVIIPEVMKKYMINLLHESHFGIVKTKKRARQLIFWKGMTKDIEENILKCTICERYQSEKTKEPIIQRDLPRYPFEVIVSDICTLNGKDYLVIACYLTKWLDIVEIKTKTANEVIEKLKVFCGNHGIPRILISDNVPYNSHPFTMFTREWGIEQSLISPTYSQANGMAEKMVGVAKAILKRIKASGQDLQLALLDYRCSPLDGLSVSPAQMAVSRMLRTKLPISIDLLKPKVEDVTKMIQERRVKQKLYYNRNAKRAKSPKRGDSVLLRRGEEWEPAILKQEHISPRSYLVTDKKGRTYRRNKRHVRLSHNPPPKIEGWKHEEPKETDGEAEKTKPSDQAEYKPGYITRFGRINKKPTKLNDYVA